MNILHRILRLFRNPVALGLLAATTLSVATEAANIQLCVRTGGRLALIVPGSNLGGRVIYSPQYGCYITDRASRGEDLLVTVYPTSEWSPVVCESYLRSTAGQHGLGITSMWCPVWTRVPTSPSWDDNHVWVRTVCGWFKQRIPVGSR